MQRELWRTATLVQGRGRATMTKVRNKIKDIFHLPSQTTFNNIQELCRIIILEQSTRVYVFQHWASNNSIGEWNIVAYPIPNQWWESRRGPKLWSALGYARDVRHSWDGNQALSGQKARRNYLAIIKAWNEEWTATKGYLIGLFVLWGKMMGKRFIEHAILWSIRQVLISYMKEAKRNTSDKDRAFRWTSIDWWSYMRTSDQFGCIDYRYSFQHMNSVHSFRTRVVCFSTPNVQPCPSYQPSHV